MPGALKSSRKSVETSLDAADTSVRATVAGTRCIIKAISDRIESTL